MSFAANINGLDYSPNGNWLAIVFNDRAVRILDAKSLEERQTITGHAGAIYTVHFAPNSELLATAGWGKSIHIWSVETGQQVKELVGTGESWGVSFCQDSTHVVSASHDGTTKIWNIATGKTVRTLGGHESTVHSVTLDHGSHRIVTSGRDGTVRIWDLSSLCKK
jgi:WD40 repeat protein